LAMARVINTLHAHMISHKSIVHMRPLCSRYPPSVPQDRVGALRDDMIEANMDRRTLREELEEVRHQAQARERRLTKEVLVCVLVCAC